MNRKSILKLGFAALIATATMFAAKPSKAAGLCVFSYTKGDRTCTYVGNDGCCEYVDQNGQHCPPICNA